MTTYTDIKVRYAETDQMGIVHHSVYAVWFEAARTDWLNSSGMSYSDVEKAGYFLPVAELNCRFKRPAHYEDIVRVAVKVSKLTPVKLVFDYELTNKKTGELLVTGSTTHAWTDKTPKLINLKKENPSLFSKLNELVNQ